MMLRKNLQSGLAAVPFAAALLSGPVLAQTAQGQFSPDANAPIQLHMPVHLHLPPKTKAVHRRKAKAAAPAPQAASSPPPASAEAAPIPFGGAATSSAARQQAKAAPARPATTNTSYAPSRTERRRAAQELLNAPGSASSSSDAAGEVSAPDAAIPFSFDTGGPPPAARTPKPAPQGSAPAPKGKLAVQSPPASKPKAGPASPRSQGQVAALTPPAKQRPAPEKPKGDPHAGLTQQGEILFDGSSTDPRPDGANALKASAEKLNAALDKGAANVELEAYGGAPGDKSSEARRLSLRRALTVRQLLIDGGIPANRIVVKAMGGAEDQGNPQRVDVYLRGAPS